MLDISFTGAAIAGLLSFLSPCVLPIVPFYLCYLAGLSMSELRGQADMPAGAGRRLVASSVAFAFGVTSVFMLFGLGATALGQAFLEWRVVLQWVAAAVLMAFGLHFLGVVRIGFLYLQARFESTAPPKTVLGAFVVGLAFGFGWTPCIGPALAAILMVAAGMGDLWRGTALLAVYGLAMTLPFVVAALFSGPFLSWVARHRAKLAHVEKVMGAMLVLFAILIGTNTVEYLALAILEWMPWLARLG